MNIVKRSGILKRGTQRQSAEVIVSRGFTDRLIYDTYKTEKVERDYLDFFIRRTVTLTPCWEAKTMKEFCAQAAPPAPTERLQLRLDDREYKTNSSRPYPDPLSVDQLHQYLSEARFKAVGLPDAHRRLVSVRNLDAKSMSTLAETALFHQGDMLKDAFCQHLHFETSIRVHESLNGFVTPGLEFHLPYLTLRESNGTHGNIRKEWADITFLNRAAAADLNIGRDIIHEAHISIVICIWDYKTWTGYKLSKPCPFDAEDPVEDEDEDDEEGEEGLPREDIFAPDSGDHNMNDDPIWDPRIYFLHIMAIWVNFILKEYIHLIRTLEERVKISEEDDHSDVQKFYTYTIKTSRLLRRVRDHTREVIEAWKAFSARDGDIRYFRTLKKHNAKVAISAINESFRRLSVLDQKLASLITTCKESSEALGLQLNVHSNVLSKQTHRETLVATKLNRKTTIIAKESQKAAVKTHNISQISFEVLLFTTPFILALQYFGAEREIFSFDRNTKNFICCVIVLMLILRLFIWALEPFSTMKLYIVSKTSRLFGRSGTAGGDHDDDDLDIDGNETYVCQALDV
ncbi:hypothetical protein BU25DRAFT_408133 [Macroventuria anomochaeta]|uniref:Uncharacterized protein n=1 Tax=Macroventuria anomochaeta TaxID=301207 RepID=A0ACB6S9G5_9PLEO|nr:uncharacterized protein BU25DRAFT_408133 [Macroventuria anomochaeta]KAF2630856.1 hypothetical protein BU25DRAFT_408133 [Macroventuria anomochaeta]